MFKNLITTFFLSALFFQHLDCQVNETFADGEFSSNPSWIGTAVTFKVNNNNQLQTNDNQAGLSYLVTEHQFIDLIDKEWSFWVKLAFSPSSNNNARIYLTADNTDLSIQPEGYYLQLGETGSNDAVHLMRRLNNQDSIICSGELAQIASSFAISIKVTRDSLGIWKLFVDPSGLSNFNQFTTGVDTSAIVGTVFGVLSKYTITNATKFYLDDIYVGEIRKDLTPPKLVEIQTINSHQIDCYFDEQLDQNQLTNSSVWTINSGAYPISQIVPDDDIVHLLLDQPLENGEAYELQVQNVIDLEGNQLNDTTITFDFLSDEATVYGDVIITELMTDPSPSVGLPEIEYIELYNRSTKFFNLKDWEISDKSTNGKLPEYWLRPNEYVVLCANNQNDELINSIHVSSFPSLNNTSDLLKLYDDHGRLIEQVNYESAWYNDDEKSKGGYALERIDLTLKCNRKENWKASKSIYGGTPGTLNSVAGNFQDYQKPYVHQIIASDTLVFIFNEPIDSTSIWNTSIQFNPDLNYDGINISSAYADTVKVFLSESLKHNQTYQLTIQQVSDCSLNKSNIQTNFVLAEKPIVGDLVINEVLFNPLDGGSDYIELYNKSPKNLELNGITFARYKDGMSDQIRFEQNHTVLAYDYVTFSADTNFINQNYSQINGKKVQMQLPNLNNDSSTIYLIYDQVVWDKLSYKEDWHIDLVEEYSGKSLERISASEPSQSRQNWRTAASGVNYGTPSAINSQNWNTDISGTFELNATTITPNNDGDRDNLLIKYSLDKPSMMGTFSVYDANGILVKQVFQNQIMATEGMLNWECTNESAQLVPAGIYIALFEFFDLEGEIHNAFKKTFVLYR